jgi:oxaloacetate decarboxylase gamma subunit
MYLNNNLNDKSIYTLKIRSVIMTELMGRGIELMFVGMSVVFLFLTMLVIAINGMSLFIQRFFPDQPVNIKSTSAKINTPEDKAIIAAITAALIMHRNKK